MPVRGRGFRQGPYPGRNASIAPCGTPVRPCSRSRPKSVLANPRRQPCSCLSSGIPAASACPPTSASSPVRSDGRRRQLLMIHRSSERVRQAPVRNFVGAVGSSFGKAAWTRRGRSETIRAKARNCRVERSIVYLVRGEAVSLFVVFSWEETSFFCVISMLEFTEMFELLC